MEFNLIEILTLIAVTYLLSTIFRLEQRVKTLNYKVEQLSAHTDVTDEELYQELHKELNVLIQQGKDVQAVKRVREAKGMSLVEAKQYVDHLKMNES